MSFVAKSHLCLSKMGEEMRIFVNQSILSVLLLTMAAHWPYGVQAGGSHAIAMTVSGTLIPFTMAVGPLAYPCLAGFTCIHSQGCSPLLMWEPEHKTRGLMWEPEQKARGFQITKCHPPTVHCVSRHLAFCGYPSELQPLSSKLLQPCERPLQRKGLSTLWHEALGYGK